MPDDAPVMRTVLPCSCFAAFVNILVFGNQEMVDLGVS